MPATVLLPTILRPSAGGASRVEAEGSTLGEVFSNLAGRFPELGGQLRDSEGALPPFLNVFVDDEDVRYLGGLDAPVREGGVITVLPAVAGG